MEWCVCHGTLESAAPDGTLVSGRGNAHFDSDNSEFCDIIRGMAFSLQWTDYPEPADDDGSLDRCELVPDRAEDVFPSDCGAMTGSIFIGGDNYPVLKKILPAFRNRVDVIYIDPPYNTGNSFTYRDSRFDGADRHSKWLSFMDRRLRAARPFLRESGCIFISIGQDELYVLKILCDGIFGEDNFVNDFSWLHGKGKKDRWSRTMQQHTLCYAMDKKYLRPFSETEISGWAKSNQDGDPRGNWFSGSISFSEGRSNHHHRNFYRIVSPSGVVWERQWLVSEDEMRRLMDDGRIFWGTAPEFRGVPRIKIFNGDRSEVIPRNIIDCSGSTRAAQHHLDSLLGCGRVFDNPKPVGLLRRLISITGAGRDAVVMDFFAGSGTTFEAVAELNSADGGSRRCILVQNDEPASGASGFDTIADICRARIRRVSELNPSGAGAASFFRLERRG